MSTTFINRGHFYAPHVKPVLIDCHFQVSHTDSSGLGIVAGSLKGQGVSAVYMETNESSPAGSPSPQAGYIVVKLADNYQTLYGFESAFRSPLTGTPILVASAGVTAADSYVITTVGTTTYTGWASLGMPPGITPAVGVAFTATVTGTASGTGAVQLIAATGSTCNHIEILGDPMTTLNPVPVGGSPNVGGWITLACFGSTGSSGVNAIQAPADLTWVYLQFYLSQSSVVVLGE
jgi:hypothetical protein